MNRAQRRQAEKKGVAVSQKGFDPTTTFKLKYDLSVPGGLLRSPYPHAVSGQFEAVDEADLLRGIVVKCIETFGYVSQINALSGLIGEVFNPLPKNIRGTIAVALIEGLGLSVWQDEEDVCMDKKCGAVKNEILHPDPESIDGYDPLDDDMDAPLLDVTEHAEECHVHREVDPLYPERPLVEPSYTREPVLVVSNPRRFEPLNEKKIDPKTGDVNNPLEVSADAETGGGLSTVDANKDEGFVYNVEDEDERERKRAHAYRNDDSDSDSDDTYADPDTDYQTESA